MFFPWTLQIDACILTVYTCELYVASEISEGIIVSKITWKTHLPIVKSGGWK
jgi:hypothetical protein